MHEHHNIEYTLNIMDTAQGMMCCDTMVHHEDSSSYLGTTLMGEEKSRMMSDRDFTVKLL